MRKKIYLLLMCSVMSSMAFGQIFITELADPSDDAGARYVELFNAGETDVDLAATAYGLRRYTNGNAEPQATVYWLTGSIKAKGFYLVASSSTGFEGAYGSAADQVLGTGGPADSNGDDQILLVQNNGTDTITLDIFGVPGEDGNGTCHGFLDGRAERAATVTAENSGTWNTTNWNVWGDDVASSCTNYTTQTIATTDGIFDPGLWIGYSASNTIVNFELVGSSINENDGSIDVCVSIENADAGAATTVDVNLDASSTAVNGTDFTSITFPQTLSFPAGNSDNLCLNITITDDTDVELLETVVLVLENVAGGNAAELGTQTMHVVSITDDDLTCPNAGDIVITEVMQNPTSSNDPDGEWFEIYNTTTSDINMFGLNFRDDANAAEYFYIDEELVIEAGSHLVFAYHLDPELNGGLLPDFQYPDNITLANSTDGLILQCKGAGIDTVIWDNGATFPDPTGASMALQAGKENYIDNNNGANWDTTKVFIYGLGDKGTPGCSNDAPCCDLVLGYEEKVCDAETTGEDTYSVLIPFVGGGTSTYTLSTTAGTISGDDPNSNQAGTIVITGITEGTDIAVGIENTAVGGACNYTIEVLSPYCYIATCAEAGSIIVTEVMQNPKSVSDYDGEWFELHNTTNQAIDIHGWDITDDNYLLHGKLEIGAVEHELIIPAGGYALFVVNDTAEVNGGLPTPDFTYVYGFPTLANATDGLTIRCEGSVIDSILWDNGATFPDPNGASMALLPGKHDAIQNDTGSNWITEATFSYGDGDFGTPGYSNAGPTCDIILETPVASCDAETAGADTYTVNIEFSSAGLPGYAVSATTGTVGGDDPTDMASGTITVTGITEGADVSITVENNLVAGGCSNTLDVVSPLCYTPDCPAEGSIIITEIMQNPQAVGDDMGEWLEVYNTTAGDIEMQGWTIEDDDRAFAEEGFTVTGSLIVPAGSYVLLANNDDAATNGGLPAPGYAYDASAYLLGNGSDGIVLKCGDTQIDAVIWDGGTSFPDPTGASMYLSVNHMNYTDNDQGANWGTSTISYGDGDLGSPTAENESVSVENNAILGFSVYPNPVKDAWFNVRFSDNTRRIIAVCDLLGKTLIEVESEDEIVRISTNLEAGIYILNIRENGKTASYKLCVSN